MSQRQPENKESVSQRIATALEGILQKMTAATEPHPLSHMSNEEIAIVLAMRGEVTTKKKLAERLGVTERAVQKWHRFAVAFDAFKRGISLGRITKGFKKKDGDIEGISKDNPEELD